MPTILRTDGYRFFFYSNEGDPREPVHIHIMQGRAEAKFWLEPDIRLARSHGFDARTLRKLASMVQTHSDTITRGWHDHFSN
ncbi:MAG: DUF4160 domain-containing protein [Pseudomonadota bacterium]